jgi:hypothetical protein
MLDDDAIITIYKKVLTEVPEFTKDLLRIYVKAPIYGNCIIYNVNQAMETLQIRYIKCEKGILKRFII